MFNVNTTKTKDEDGGMNVKAFYSTREPFATRLENVMDSHPNQLQCYRVTDFSSEGGVVTLVLIGPTEKSVAEAWAYLKGYEDCLKDFIVGR